MALKKRGNLRNSKGLIYIINLIGGLEHEFYFPFHIWDVILPID